MTRVLLRHVGKRTKDYQYNLAKIVKTAVTVRSGAVSNITIVSSKELKAGNKSN